MSKNRKKRAERSSGRVTDTASKTRYRAKPRKKKGILAAILNPKNRRNLFIAAAVLLLVATSARTVFKLEMENRRLRAKNKQLIETKKQLQIELKNVNSKEYIEEQARKQLRLVDPDEILFVFPNEKDDRDSSK